LNLGLDSFTVYEITIIFFEKKIEIWELIFKILEKYCLFCS
jgi:hypothetical protein